DRRLIRDADLHALNRTPERRIPVTSETNSRGSTSRVHTLRVVHRLAKDLRNRRTRLDLVKQKRPTGRVNLPKQKTLRLRAQRPTIKRAAVIRNSRVRLNQTRVRVLLHIRSVRAKSNRSRTAQLREVRPRGTRRSEHR